MRKIIFFGILFSTLMSFTAIGQVTLSVFEDKQKLSFSEIQSADFVEVNSNYIYRDFTTDIIWLKIVLDSTNYSGKRIVFSNSFNNFEEIFFVRSNAGVKKYSFGTDQHFQSATYLPSFLIPAQTEVIYVRISSHTFIYEWFDIDEDQNVLKKSTAYLILHLFVLLLFLVVLINVLVLYQKTKRSIFGYYALYVLSALCMMFFVSNLGRYLIWKELLFSNSYLEGMFSFLFSLSYTYLTIRLTEVKENSKILFRICQFFIPIYSLIYLGVVIFGTPYDIGKISNFLPALSLILILVLTVNGLIKRNENSLGIYLIGVLAFSAGMFTRLFINWGILEYSITNELFGYLGILIELALFTYVVITFVEQKVRLNRANAILVEEYASTINQLQGELIESKENKTDQFKSTVVEITLDINQFLRTPLTKREVEVLNEISKGGKYESIAKKMFISVTTLKTHISRIYVKLDTNNRIDAINKANELTNRAVEV